MERADTALSRQSKRWRWPETSNTSSTISPMSPDQRRSYPWRRFWVKPGMTHLDADEGFFPGPSDGGLFVPSLPALELADVAELPVAILLGEPGLGKSRTIRDAIGSAAEVASNVWYLDLGAFDDARLLDRALFDSARWRTFVSGSEDVELWLDSLDEAMLQLRSIEKLLLHELGALDAADRARLRLRIACRSADWSDAFEEGLTLLWPGEGAISRLQLAPLRREDVRVAANAHGLDGDAFVADIVERGLTQLAALPLTLSMLLETAELHRELPTTQADLFRRGCRLLCEEPNRRRRDTGSLHAGQRLAVAQRVAATTLLAGRAAVTTAADARSGRDIRLVEIAGGHERDPEAAAPVDFRVDVPQIEEALQTALFTVTGARARFAHRALAEFLAACWLVDRRLEAEQVMSLVVAAVDDEGRIVPQLREVAAWAGALRPDLLTELLAREPELLLRVEHLDLSPDDRERIIAALLADEQAAERVERFDRRVRRALSGLEHPALAQQVRKPLRDPGAPLAVRQLAITVARACRLRDAQPDLLALALDDSEPAYVRDDAVAALAVLADDDTRKALIPLAVEPQPADTDDEVKGQALKAIFPRVASLADILPGITALKNPHLIGGYRMFLSETLPSTLAADDLPAALSWLAEHERSGPVDSTLEGVADAVIVLAWRQLDRPGIPEALWEIVAVRLERSEDLVSSERRRKDPAELTGAEQRHRLLPLLAHDVAQGRLQPFWATYADPPLLVPEDVPWLLGKVKETNEQGLRRAWADLAAAAFRPELADVDATLEAAFDDPVLREAMSAWIDPVSLDSEHAQQHRRRAARRRQPERQHPRRDIDGEIQDHLDRLGRGDTAAWPALNRLLIADEDGRLDDYREIEADLRRLPGWERAGEETRARILSSAKQYLLERQPESGSWFSDNTHAPFAWAGYRALVLVAALEPGWLDALPDDAWARWAPAIIGYPRGTTEGTTPHDVVLDRAIAAVPDAMADWIVRDVRNDDRRQGTVFGLWRFERPLPLEVLEALAAEAENVSLQPESRRRVLEFVLGRDRTAGVARAAHMLEAAPPVEGGDTRAFLTGVASTALRLAFRDTWPLVREVVTGDVVLGRAIFEQMVAHADYEVTEELDESMLADVIDALFALFPPEDDPPLTAGAGFVTHRSQAGRLRDGLVANLAARGTDAAVRMIQRLDATHQHAGVLPYRLKDAREARRARWPAPEPRDIVALAERTDARIVVSDEHLQQLLVASLRRAQTALRGTPPRVLELWNQNPLTPKDEGALSDWLQSWFEQDLRLGGRLIGRELQVRPSASGKGVGESVDLHVSAAAGELVADAETLNVRVEVKGCWNPELETALSGQLAARYLQASALDRGLFVVGHYDAEGWAKDWRRSKCRNYDSAAALERYVAQADGARQRYGVHIVPVILDARIPPPRHRRARRKAATV